MNDNTTSQSSLELALAEKQREIDFLKSSECEAAWCDRWKRLCAERDNLRNENEALRVDAMQWQRAIKIINDAMPDFKSAMGSEADHAEVALIQLVNNWITARVELETLWTWCKIVFHPPDGRYPIEHDLMNHKPNREAIAAELQKL